MKITKEQYQDALNIVINYRDQLKAEVDKINNIVSKIDINDNIASLDLKWKTKNMICRAIKLYNRLNHIEYDQNKPFKLKDLLKLSTTDLRKTANIGVKTINEIQSFLNKYNYQLK